MRGSLIAVVWPYVKAILHAVSTNQLYHFFKSINVNGKVLTRHILDWSDRRQPVNRGTT